jgi:predicted acylesterase/phospholipase RssA
MKIRISMPEGFHEHAGGVFITSGSFQGDSKFAIRKWSDHAFRHRSVKMPFRGIKLLDGGVTCQVPVDVVRALGARVTVGVSLGLAYLPEHVRTPASAVAGMVGMLGVHQLRRSLDLADLGFQIEGIEHRSLVKARQPDLIDLGERDMEARIDELRGLLRRRWKRRAPRAA